MASTEYPHIYPGPCAYDPCPEEGIHRIRRGNTWAQLCTTHLKQINAGDIHDEWVAAGKPTAEECTAKARAILSNPKRSPIDHWRKVLADPMSPVWAKLIASEALGKLTEFHPDRVPGEDDE